MTINYTSLLSLAEPVTGTQSGTWGDDVNQGLTDYLDIAVAGAQVISGSQTAVTLSKTTGSAAGSNIAQVGSAGTTGTAQYAVINCTGNPASMLTITAPATSKTYVVINATSTNQSVKLVGAGPTTGVTVAASQAALIAWKGADFALIATTDASKLTGTLGVGNGGTGQTTAQAAINALAGAVTSGSYLRGNGTNVAMSAIQAADLPTATDSANGAIKLGSGTAQSVAANAVTATASRTYALQLNTSGQGVVNVPWTDTSSTSPGGSTTQVQYNNAGAFGGSASFVFDGTNVGIGTASPSSYGKLTVLSSAEPKAAIVTTSTNDVEQAYLELRKTNNIGATASNQIGRISFYSRQGSTDTESAYINVRDNRQSGVSSPELVLNTYIAGTGGGPRLKLAQYSELVSYDTLYYSATNGHTFDGAVNFTGATTVSSVPVVTTTGTQTLSNKTLASNTVATTQAAGDSTTKVATTQFVQQALPGTTAGSIGSYILATYSGPNTINFGDTVVSSFPSAQYIKPVNLSATSVGNALNGTFVCMGQVVTYGNTFGPYSTAQIQDGSTLWLRTS